MESTGCSVRWIVCMRTGRIARLVGKVLTREKKEYQLSFSRQWRIIMAGSTMYFLVAVVL